MQILIAEDDVRLAQALAHILEENGYGTDVVHEGETGLAYAELGNYDVIILDVMLPKKDGFSVVADLRRANVSTPVLLLTARDAVPDKITGLDSGADDYMTKPFSPAELLAHLRALTRRQGEVLFEKLTAGDLTLNLESYDLSRGAKSIHLSYKEFSLEKVLMANAGQVVSKDLLIAKVWGVESTAEDNNVEAYVSFLRKKMKFLGSTARIETLRRAGYRFMADEGAEANADASCDTGIETDAGAPAREGAGAGAEAGADTGASADAPAGTPTDAPAATNGVGGASC